MSPLSNIDENHELYPVLRQVYDDMDRVEERIPLPVSAADFSQLLEGDVTIGGTLTIGDIIAGTVDYDSFLVSDGGEVKYRTATQMLEDLGIGEGSEAGHIHDVRYYTEDELNAGQLDNRYYTETEIDDALLVYYTGTPTAGHIPYFTGVETIAMDENQLFWDATNNRLGIGTEVPVDLGHFYSGASGAAPHSYAQVVMESSTHFSLQLLSPNTQNQYIMFGDPEDNNAGQISYEHDLDKMTVQVAGNPAITIVSVGKVGFGPLAGNPWGNLETRAADGVSNKITIRKATLDDTHPLWAFDHQTDDQDLWVYTYDGDAYKYFIKFDYGNAYTSFMAGNVGIGTVTPGVINGVDLTAHHVLQAYNATLTSRIVVEGANASVFDFVDRGGAANQKHTLLEASAELFRIKTVNDAGALVYTPITCDLSTGYVGIEEVAPDKLFTLKDEGDAGSKTFTSGWTAAGGVGWNLDYVSSLYKAEVDDLVVRGALSVYELIINQISAVNGSMIISAARGKVASVTVAAPDEVVVMEDPEDNGYSTFAENDIVMIQRVDLNAAYTVVKRIVRKVASVTGAAVTMSAAAGAPADTGSIVKGDCVVVIGNLDNTARDASIYISATDSNNPFIRIKDVVTSWADWADADKMRVAMGNMNGVYGYAAEIHGFAAGDPSGPNVTVDPTNGIRFRAEETTLAQLTGTTFTMYSGPATGKRIVIGTDTYPDPDYTNALVFYTDATTEVLRIDDAIYGTWPGIALLGGVVYIYNVDATVPLCIRCYNTFIGNESINAIDSLYINDDLDANARTRVAVSGASNIGHEDSTSTAIGIYGSAVNDGSGGVWAGYFGPGDVYIENDLKVAGAISSGTLTLTASNDNLDVSGVNVVFINITGNIILGGLTGGVDGQVIEFVYKGNYVNNITFEDTEGVGDQDFYMHTRSDETFEGGGITFSCDGSNWYNGGHGKHV